MIEITNMKEVVENIKLYNFTPDLIKDILLQVFIFDTEFEKPNQNKLVVLDENETYDTSLLVPEFEEDIDDYHKTLYIICDSGEGLLIYKKKGGKNE